MTQMCMVVVLSENVGSNARAINRAWSEIGLGGRAVSCKLDSEPELAATLRRAARLENAAITALNLELTPPDRHQANGKVERWHGLIKHAAATHVLYVESRIGGKIALESALVEYALTYTARMMKGARLLPLSGCVAGQLRAIRCFLSGVFLLESPWTRVQKIPWSSCHSWCI